MTERNGTWMQTATGRKFYPLDPRADEIHIEDIAHALSHVCRFGGHGKWYSVAQHSVMVSQLVPSEHALWGLLHDAAEAYIGDMIRPLKIFMPEFRTIEDGILSKIAERFALVPKIPRAVKEADEAMLATELRDIMGGEKAGIWDLGGTARPNATIEVWKPAYAKLIFLGRFRQLTDGERATGT